LNRDAQRQALALRHHGLPLDGSRSPRSTGARVAGVQASTKGRPLLGKAPLLTHSS